LKPCAETIFSKSDNMETKTTEAPPYLDNALKESIVELDREKCMVA
jgi:hypothetical protein